jgi:hypothetical protein
MLAMPPPGRDGALRRPRRVQRRNNHCDGHVMEYSFSPLDAGWDGAAHRSYQDLAPTLVSQLRVFHEGVAEQVANAHLRVLDAAVMGIVDDKGVIGDFGHASALGAH